MTKQEGKEFLLSIAKQFNEEFGIIASDKPEAPTHPNQVDELEYYSIMVLCYGVGKTSLEEFNNAVYSVFGKKPFPEDFVDFIWEGLYER